MAYYKSLKKGEHLTISGAATITAVSSCKLMVEADENVIVDGLEWTIGENGRTEWSRGKYGQEYVINSDIAFYHGAGAMVTKLSVGDNPKAACEAHNKVWNGE